MIHRTSSSLFLFFSTLLAVCRAFLANRFGDRKWVPLPAVAAERDTSLSPEQTVDLTDRIVRLVVINTAHACLYYSYARCCALRRRGYKVKLNMGLHSLHDSVAAEGHCWISLDGRPQFEEKDPHKLYPDKMGERDDFVYWARVTRENGKRASRERKE